MIEKFKSFDLYILDNIFEPIAKFFREWFGWSCFTLSRLCLVFMLVIDFVIVPSLFGCRPYYGTGIVFLIWMYFTYDAEKRASSSTKIRCTNPERNIGATVRLLLIIFNVLFISRNLALFIMMHDSQMLSVNLSDPLLLAHLYFRACSNPPPEKSKVKEFLESLGMNPSMAPIE